MKEAKGDIWEYAGLFADACCVLTNMTVAGGKLIMGGGQAREARDRFPSLPALWSHLNDTGVMLYDREDLYVVVSFPTKYHPSDNSDIELIEQSAQTLVKLADKYQWQEVVLPRPGCGLGGLKWEEVRPILQRHLDIRFTVITNV